jgi:hypothetical protein
MSLPRNHQKRLVSEVTELSYLGIIFMVTFGFSLNQHYRWFTTLLLCVEPLLKSHSTTTMELAHCLTMSLFCNSADQVPIIAAPLGRLHITCQASDTLHWSATSFTPKQVCLYATSLNLRYYTPSFLLCLCNT